MKRRHKGGGLPLGLEDAGTSKARLLEAAENLFARRGYSGRTTRQIALAAGLNISTLHYYWGSKQELWSAVHYNLMSRATDLARTAMEGLEGMQPREAFRAMIRSFFDFASDNPNMMLIMQQPKPTGIERPWTSDVGVPFMDTLKTFVREKMQLDFSPADLDIAVHCFVGAFEFFFIRPDLVELYFGEKLGDFSEEFKERAATALLTMFERFGEPDET